MRFILKLLAVMLVAGAWAGRGRAADSVTLNDGRTIEGTIEKEDADTVWIKLANGDQRAVAKVRIDKIYRSGQGEVAAGKPPEKGGEKRSRQPKDDGAKTSGAQVAVIKDLAAFDPEKRKAALEKIKSDADVFLPVMLAMLHPKQPTDEVTRVRILRAMSELQLNEQAGKTLAYVCTHDPYAEARREACATIRQAALDDAMRELSRYAASEEAATRYATATAMREIDDPRVLRALAASIPQPTVNANNAEPSGLDKPKYVLPTGPGGLNMPIYLPTQEVSGVATDIDSPGAQMLKLIARKNLGNLPHTWSNWFREKYGEITSSERDEYRDKRSVRSRLGVPPGK
jgi:hypothetical protein